MMKMDMQRIYTAMVAVTVASAAVAAEPADTTELHEVVVTSANTTVRKLSTASNTSVITTGELRRAACCNLGESFTTNPSVDVNYSDAASGARQIRLLGLSGNYVQMLTENIPSGRGAAAPYATSYIAGPWMQSIQVSKGASSVKNGYESITGQINVELKKPQNDPQVNVNLYYDSMNKLEANVDGNLHLGDRWSTGLLVHAENAFTPHDSNGDGFVDLPQTRQVAALNRWAYMGTDYVFQGGVKMLGEWRRGGQRAHGSHVHTPYLIDINGRRAEFFTKNAYIFDHDHDGNVALILSGSYHSQDDRRGNRISDIDQAEGYASLMFERKWDGGHALSTGLSLNVDDFRYRYNLSLQPADRLTRLDQLEAVGGVYGQYTYNLSDRLIAMAGLRYDRHNLYGNLVTPRLHLRWTPADLLSVHASTGRGYHAPHPLAEYSYLMASSRRIEIAPHLDMERAWNWGAGFTVTASPDGHRLDFSAEYYNTRFDRMLVADLDTDPHAAIIYTSDRPGYSHALQLETTAAPTRDLTLTAAWRFTDVKVDYGQGPVQKPLTSRHKVLLTVSYQPMMGLWQADVTMAVNGGGKMPTPYRLSDGSMSWPETYKAYPQLSAQLTRNFRHWALYVGGENLTGFRQPNPVIGASDPWGPDFDATMVYGPLHGAMVYAGFRFNFTKYL